jgi:hypothetical protein
MRAQRPGNDAPRGLITKARQRHVVVEVDAIDFHAYTFCV